MKTRAFLLALPILALSQSGCAENHGTPLAIQDICAPTDTCKFSNTCDATAMGNPRIDPSITSYLALILQVANQLPNNADKDLMRVNTNDAHVDEVSVEYSGLLSGTVVLGAQGTVPAADTNLIYVEIIPASMGASLPPNPPAFPEFGEVQAKLRLRGYYDDGTRFETAEFPVTIQVELGGVNTCAGACPQPGQWPSTCPST